MTTAPTTKPKNDNRIPASLRSGILGGFAQSYLTTLDEIAAYNAEVLQEKNSEWNARKVLEKSESFARPTDGSEADKSILEAREKFEALVNELNLARKNVITLTSEKLGISLSAVADRDSAKEEKLNDDRKNAFAIGSQLEQMSKLMAMTDATAAETVQKFLSENPLPSVGRESVKTFGTNEPSTIKWRVQVEVKKDDKTVEFTDTKGNTFEAKFDGFTKAALALTNKAFGYERSQAPKADKLRAAWEAKGNKDNENVQTPEVEFHDNGLTFIITKK